MTSFEQRLKDSLSHAYDIERELGGGGMSRVFVATDRSLGRKVVIKLLSPELTAEVNRGRFRREIQVAAQLQHPHIVTLLSAGEDGELVYYTMPFIEGESLRSALEKDGPLSVRDVVRVLYNVVDALSYAHERGVVHRDIKPANILRSGNHALVTDFGVAKALNASMPSSAMTSTGMAIGTPAYMAPEQLAGDSTADHRIDIYAVGLLAYELLSGQSPFVAASPQAVLAAVLTRDPKPLNEVREDVPQRLSEMIMQCLSKIPGGRPPKAEELLLALDIFSTPSGEIRTTEYRARATPVSGVAPVVAAFAASVPSSVPASVANSVPISAPPTVPTAVPSSATVPAVTDSPTQKSRNRFLVGGLALLLFTAAGAFALSRRDGGKPLVATIQPPNGASSDPAGLLANPVVVPTVITPVDSLAIAESVKQRLAQAVAAVRPGQVAINTDSLRQRLRRDVTDSIARANAAQIAGAAPVTQPIATAPTVATAPVPPPAAEPAAPPAPSGRRRLAIAEPRQNRDQPVFNRFSRALVDALRASLDNEEAFALVDQDSVRDALAQTRTRDEAARILNPDVMVAPSYVGAGDTVNIVVTVWDLRSNSSYGIRVTSARLVPSNPEQYLGPIVQSVLKQLDDLARAPTIYRRR